MNNSLKLALLGAAITVSLASSPVLAGEHAADAHATEAAAAAQTVELKDGTKVEIHGDSVSVIGADGSKTPAPDGTHTTADGQTITTKDGKVVKSYFHDFL